MPMIDLRCSKEVPPELQMELSTVVAETIGKPEQYVMVATYCVDMMMGGKAGDAVYAEVKSLGGLNRVVNHELTMKICILFNDHLGISSDRIYVTFQSFERNHWGWNETLFG